MWAAALVPIVATALGTALALGAERWHVVLQPVRSFALAAVVVTIAVHLLPDAVEVAGPWTVLLLGAGLLLPSALGWAGAKLHAAVAVELGFVAVIAHQIGDGLAMGVVGPGHWDFVLAIGAHTVPLAAVVAISFARDAGRGHAIARAVVIALAPLIGLIVVRAGATASAAPWLDAVVAGLLLHVLAHDLPSAHGRTPTMRTVELVAIAAGAALPILAGDHDADAGVIAARLPHALGELARASAPALLAGVLLGAVVNAIARKTHVHWLAGGRGPLAALRGAALALPLPPCSCDIVPAARDLRTRGGGAALVVGFVFASPEVGAGAVLLTVALFGWKLALVRLGAALALATVVALVVERLGPEAHAAPIAGDLPEGPTSLLEGIDDHVAHDGAWVLVGLTVAAFVAAAASTHALGGWTDLVVIAIAVPLLTVSATAATPIAFALMAVGMRPGAAIAAVLLGSMLNLTTLGFVRRAYGTAAATATVAAAIAVAIGVALAVNAAGLDAAPVRTSALVEDGALAVLIALAAASLWRHGLAHWLAALRGSDHGHVHEHGLEHAHHHHHDHEDE